ncbi:MAG: YajQ family cyclic di-GMP-binding protein [Beggiatoa sp. IS2]|nr:MAG: YajQ family cyclic di-GMP-binding protein [Beggiatoa sp. IS2]
MPSFDVVSEVNSHELANAVDQTNREVGTRFDFKDADARVESTESTLTLHAENEFQLRQMQDILYKKLAKRNVDIAALEVGQPEIQNRRARLLITVKQGIDKELAKKIVKLVKEGKLKVQASVQGEQVRITGKKRDDLQQVIALLREQELDLPLQFTNFRD